MIANCCSSPAAAPILHKVEVGDSNYLIVGDFNSHSQSLGYEKNDQRGEETEEWVMENELIFINQTKDEPTYYSRVWMNKSTPT